MERNIYRRRDASGNPVFEVGYRDSAGKQRWKTVPGGITAARAARDDLLGRKARGERVQPNPGLKFQQAAARWLDGQVAELRPATQAIYRNAIATHLAPRWARRRLDAISVDDVAQLVQELRREGKSEWTIAGVLKAANRVFKFATRRLGWFGTNPVAALEDGERPRPGAEPKRRIFTADELAQTLAAAPEPFRTLFALAAVTGARLSECLGLSWDDVDLTDPDAATVTFNIQVDRSGRRQPLKTAESCRSVQLPQLLAQMLHDLQAARPTPAGSAFVFATRSGRPLGQRNVMRALRQAQRRAVDEHGVSTFPVLQHRDRRGRPVPPPRGAVPSFHSFRHTAASQAIAAGESAEEIAWQLGHRNSVVTRAVYVQEIKTTERAARNRARMEDQYGGLLRDLRTSPQP